ARADPGQGVAHDRENAVHREALERSQDLRARPLLDRAEDRHVRAEPGEIDDIARRRRVRREGWVVSDDVVHGAVLVCSSCSSLNLPHNHPLNLSASAPFALNDKWLQTPESVIRIAIAGRAGD